jgi:hypothetical protein
MPQEEGMIDANEALVELRNEIIGITRMPDSMLPRLYGLLLRLAQDHDAGDLGRALTPKVLAQGVGRIDERTGKWVFCQHPTIQDGPNVLLVEAT